MRATIYLRLVSVLGSMERFVPSFSESKRLG